jgi:hypothetical protein
MTKQDMQQFSEKTADYQATIGEIKDDMRKFATRCEADGDMMMHMRFEAAKILLAKAVEGLEAITEITDAETIAKEVA